MTALPRISMKVTDLPLIDGRFRIRTFRIRDDLSGVLSQNNGMVRLRQEFLKTNGLAEAAKKIQMQGVNPTRMGLSRAGINCLKLTQFMTNYTLTHRPSARGIDMVAENPASAWANVVLGRLGDEEDVFGPFDPEVTLARGDLDHRDKAHILSSYLRKLDLPALQDQAKLAFQAARIAIPNTPHEQLIFINETGVALEQQFGLKDLAGSGDKIFEDLIRSIEMEIGHQSSKKSLFVSLAACLFDPEEAAILVSFLANMKFKALGLNARIVPKGHPEDKGKLH